MNMLLPRFLRSAYRKDPIPSFLMTMGAADIALGGASSHGGLLFLGVFLLGGALGLKWVQSQRRTDTLPEPIAQHYLPSQFSQELPMLSMTKKRPPN
ncbi:hypothetical protein [Altericista sp. CCNU0014]|uniref:hypothetical protein n=1 Tax=Altericista sp. CCNU0014 TaxID=3082949 RepID=UPI00384F175E